MPGASKPLTLVISPWKVPLPSETPPRGMRIPAHHLQALGMRRVLRTPSFSGLCPANGSVKGPSDMIVGQHPAVRLPRASGVDLCACELQQLRTVTTPRLLRYDAEMVDRIPVEGNVANRAIRQLEDVGAHESIAQHMPPALDDCGSGIGILLRRKDVNQCIFACRTFQLSKQSAFVGPCPTDA